MNRNLMYKALAWVFMSPDPAAGGGGGGGGGGPAAPTPAEARAYLSERWHDPASLIEMKEPDVMALHGRVRPIWDKVESTAAERSQAKWRENIAGEDKTHLETLNRFASPKALYDSYHALRTKVSNGELKSITPFPATGTPEEQAAWRGSNGIPVDGKYEIKLPAGMELAEADRANVEGFSKYAHEHNMPAGVVNDVVGWWAGARAQAQTQAAEQFKQQELDTAAQLGKEWGADYKPNMNRIEGMLAQTLPNDEAGKAMQDKIMRTVKTDPLFARHYAQLALELNPAGALVGGDRGATEGSIVDELKKIDLTMRGNRKAYDADPAMQERYRTLLTGYNKVTGKDWNAAGQQS